MYVDTRGLISREKEKQKESKRGKRGRERE